MSRLEFTLLGSGFSGGVPRADGSWGDCDPTEPRNRRTRCSLLVRRRDGASGQVTALVIDTSPDFRAQCLSAGVERLDGVAFTHDHADQTHGIDDVRAFFLRQGERIPCWMDKATTASMTEKFGYIFKDKPGYPAICDARRITAGEGLEIAGPGGVINARSFDLDHGFIRALGYRIGNVAYCPDVVAIPEESFAAMAGLEVLIIDALRWSPHPSHAHVGQALAWIDRLSPRRAILTNLHFSLDYNQLKAKLPAGVEPGYDGMSFISDNIS